MKAIRHKNSQNVYSNLPAYEDVMSVYGYLTISDDSVLFFYSEDDSVRYEDVTDQYEIINL